MFLQYVFARLLFPAGLALLAAPGVAAHGADAQPPASASSSASGNRLPVKAFARSPRVHSPRLSPDGKHLLVRLDSESGDHHSLVVFQLSDMSLVSRLNMPIYKVPLDPVWVSDDWIVLEIGKAYGSLERPSATGQVISTSINGKTQRYLFGYKPSGRRAKTRGADKASGYIVGLPVKLDGHVYVRALPWGRDDLSVLYDIDATRGSRHLLAQMHAYGMSFLVGPDGKASWAFGSDEHYDYKAWRKVGKRWVAVDLEQRGGHFRPLAYTPDHKQLYALIETDGGPRKLVRQSLDGSKQTVLASDAFASVGDIQWTETPYRPFAVMPLAGVPKPVFMDRNNSDAKLYRALAKAFSGGVVDFINFSRDRSKLLFFVSSDRDPGTYYLINLKNHKVRELLKAKSWIDPATMARRQPFRFQASDGLQLGGILTFPLHHEHKNLPMVLMPHGGPYGVRDSWYFDNDAQFLANRGYLVLQVNFRGSGGRGSAFKQAGYRKWGTRIQQDLIDAVQWAIKQGYADPDRVCVYGASFGGYSALMSAIRAPDLFQCAVGYAGVYDLQGLYDEGDIRSQYAGKNYLKMVLGTDKATLAANSPLDLVDKIQVPVLLVHGEDDKRAPYDQAVALRDALKKAKKPVEWLAFNHEGHGFYTEAHRAAFLRKLQAFLHQNLASKATKPAGQTPDDAD